MICCVPSGTSSPASQRQPRGEAKEADKSVPGSAGLCTLRVLGLWMPGQVWKSKCCSPRFYKSVLYS